MPDETATLSELPLRFAAVSWPTATPNRRRGSGYCVAAPEANMPPRS